MSRLPKFFLNKAVHLVTTSVEEGLMFPPNPLINTIMMSVMARAQTLYPVHVCHFLLEATHTHLLIVVEDPDCVKNFMKMFKAESAHAVNRLLGKKKHTVWCEGYDSPSLLDVTKVIEKIQYIYINPAKDKLEDSIDNYVGLSSWRAYKEGKEEFVSTVPWIRRSTIGKLSSASLTMQQLEHEARSLEDVTKEKQDFILRPNAWMESLGIVEENEQKRINQVILDGVYSKEQEYRQERKKEDKQVIGSEKLARTPIGREYQPDRSGKRMLCLCSDVKLRKRYIAAVKRVRKQGVEVFHMWKGGNCSKKYPRGLYAPYVPRTVEPLWKCVAEIGVVEACC